MYFPKGIQRLKFLSSCFIFVHMAKMGTAYLQTWSPQMQVGENGSSFFPFLGTELCLISLLGVLAGVGSSQVILPPTELKSSYCKQLNTSSDSSYTHCFPSLQVPIYLPRDTYTQTQTTEVGTQCPSVLSTSDVLREAEAAYDIQGPLDGCLAFLSNNTCFFSQHRELCSSLKGGSLLTVLNKHLKNQSETFYGALCCSGFITLPCQGVQSCTGICVWNTSWAKLVGFQNTWRQQGVMERSWASCQEACFLLHLLHYLKTVRLYYVSWLTRSEVSFLPHWLWACSGDLNWPMEGGNDRMLVIS